MGKFTQIPLDTFEGMQLDAGVLLKAFDLKTAEPKKSDIICATSGGFNLTVTPTYSDLGEDVDNCPANMKELKHLDSWEVKVSFTSLATNLDSIRLALGAADIDAATGRVTPRRALKQTDFTDLWWGGDRADGGFLAAHLKNALSTGGFSLQTTKSGKGQVSVELTGHVSLEDQDAMPIELYSLSPAPAGATPSGTDTTPSGKDTAPGGADDENTRTEEA